MNGKGGTETEREKTSTEREREKKEKNSLRLAVWVFRSSLKRSAHLSHRKKAEKNERNKPTGEERGSSNRKQDSNLHRFSADVLR